MSKSCRTLCAIVALFASTVFATQFGDIPVSQVIGNLSVTSDSNVTLTLGGTPTDALLKATSITAGWSGQLSMARGGTGANLADPNANRLIGWDDTDNAVGWFTIGTNLTYDHATHTLNATGGGVSTVSVGNSIFVDKINGDDGTGLRGRLDKPFLTISGALAAAGLTSGDTIFVGPGTFTENGGIILPNNVSLSGSGIGVTKIQSTLGVLSGHVIVKPGNNSFVSNLTIEGTATAPTYQGPIGAGASDTAFTNATVMDIETIANSDGIYFTLNSSPCSMTVFNSVLRAKYDCVAVISDQAHAIDLRNCKLVSVGPMPSEAGDGCHGLNIWSGLTRMFGGSMEISGGEVGNVGLYATIAGSIEAYGVASKVDTSYGTSYDAQNDSGTYVRFDLARSDSASPVTAGTVVRLKGIGDMTALSGTSKLIGSSSAAAAVSEITLGTNLSMSGTTLNATGGGGAPGGNNTEVQYNNSSAFGGITNATTDGTTLTLTSPKVITAINDTNGNELFKFTATASAVNELTIANAATGAGPTISATGGDASIDLNLNSKGSSSRINLNLNGSSLIGYEQFAGMPSLYVSWIQAIGGNEQIFFHSGSGFDVRTGYNTTILYYPSATGGWDISVPFGYLDVYFARNAAGVVEVNNGTAGQYRDLYARNITLQSSGVITGSGTVPTGGTSNQVLQKNSNTNYDVGWTTLAGGGNVSNSGTPTSGQTAVWTDATHIKGETSLAGGTTSQVLKKNSNTDYDYSWGAGGGGTPGGLDTQVQFNDGGAFGGITNATTNGTTLTLTSPKIVTGINDTNGNELFKFTATASAVNELTITNAATTTSPTISATGNDANIDLGIIPKGTGWTHILGNAGQTNPVQDYGSGLAIGWNAGGGTGQEVFINEYNGAAQTFAFEAFDFESLMRITNNATGAGVVISSAPDPSVTALSLPSAGYVLWNNDTGLYRNAAGVVEVNNGTSGQYRDLKARDLAVPIAATSAIEGLKFTSGGSTTSTFQGWDNGGLSYQFYTANKYFNGTTWADTGLSRAGGALTVANDSFYYITFDTGTVQSPQFIATPGTFTFRSDEKLAFASGTSLPFTADSGFARNAAGVVEINNGTAGQYRDLYARNITLQSSGVITGSGTVPTGGTSNQVLQKNSNTNYDVGWTTLAGGGNVSNSGTPTSGQTAVWTDATHIKGETSLAGGTTSQVLKKNSNTDYDYSWGAGGGGTPGGLDTQVQFNDGGAFGGDASLLWDKTNKWLSVLGNAGAFPTGNGVAIGWNKSGGQGEADFVNTYAAAGEGFRFYDSFSNILARIVNGGIAVPTSALLGWGFAPDTALGRNADGVVEVNNGTAGQYRDLYARNITLQSSGVITGSGTVPTGGTTNQVLQKNSNTNYDVGWVTAAGGGNVSNTGTPANDQIAVWTDSTHVEGTAALTQNSNGLVNETYSDAGTGNQATGLALTHMTSNTATTDFGVGMGFNAENAAGAAIAQGVLETAWSSATNGAETSYMIFGLSNLGSPVFVAKMFGNGSLSVGGTTADPGAGYINANTGLKIGGTDIFPVTTARGGVPTGGTTSQVLQKNSNSNYDVGWTTLTGGGNVSNSGTPTVGQYARWTDATHVEGVAASTVKSDLSLTASDVGLGSVTNDEQTKAAVVPNTAPTSGQILIGNAGNTAYAKQSVSGSGATISLNDTGVISISAIANTSLSNSSITIAGTSTSLGGTITRDTITGVSSNGVVKRTGANTYSNLVDTTVGDNLLTLTNPSAITFLKVNADNTVTAEGASTFRTSLGATTVGSNVFTLGTPAGNSYVTVAANNSVSYTTAPSGTLVGTSDTQTLTNKRVNPRTNSTASATSWTPASDSYDEEIQTALAGDLTINAPSGTPVQGQKLILRITSNGSSHNVSVTTGSAGAFRALGVTLPTTIAASKTIYMGCIYNTDASRWDVVAVATEA